MSAQYLIAGAGCVVGYVVLRVVLWCLDADPPPPGERRFFDDQYAD